MISRVISNLRESVGLEEMLFMLGMVLLYSGLSAQFNHAIAQIVSGVVFLFFSVLIVLKGSSS